MSSDFQPPSELLLDETFMRKVLDEYGQSSAKPDPRGFVIKSLNIRDPLLASNNLGRSVNKASFIRICKAFRHGAKTLTKILQKVGMLLPGPLPGAVHGPAVLAIAAASRGIVRKSTHHCGACAALQAWRSSSSSRPM